MKLNAQVDGMKIILILFLLSLTWRFYLFAKVSKEKYFVNCNVKQIFLRGRLQVKGESEEFFKQVLNNSDRFNADPHHDTDHHCVKLSSIPTTAL